MAIKKYGPTTPGRRGMTVTDYSVLSKVAPERSLLEPMKKHSGRNNTGRITVRHQGGGNRTKYRVIDFKRQKTDMPATVKTLEYDPNRSAFIALVEYTDGVKNYIIAPDGLKVGDVVISGKGADIPIEKINCKNKIIFFIFMLALIPQHYYKSNFLSNWVGKLQKEEQRSNRRYSSLSIFCI